MLKLGPSTRARSGGISRATRAVPRVKPKFGDVHMPCNLAPSDSYTLNQSSMFLALGRKGPRRLVETWLTRYSYDPKGCALAPVGHPRTFGRSRQMAGVRSKADVSGLAWIHSHGAAHAVNCVTAADAWNIQYERLLNRVITQRLTPGLLLTNRISSRPHLTAPLIAMSQQWHLHHRSHPSSTRGRTATPCNQRLKAAISSRSTRSA